MSPAALPVLYDDIFTYEDYTHEQIEQLGRFLFDRLLGIDAWNAILSAAPGAAIVELALRFAGERYELHRFPWELMHGPAGFLAQGQPLASVTRLVDRREGVQTAALSFQSPPRLLFAVGTSLTAKRIRPAAEIMSLLRQLHTRNLTVRQRVLLSPYAETLSDEVAAFQPDLVHFSCHGGIEKEQEARGFLEFQLKGKAGATVAPTSKHLHAHDLLVALRHGEHLPPVVVLSACYSGSTRPAGAGTPGPTSPAPTPPPALAGPNGSTRTAAVDRIGSLAAELVAGGVPVVVGMGGQVADSACRLFTRYFGEALMSGEPLVTAAARGRRGAFLAGAVPDRADWAFPVLFMDAELGAGCAPEMDLGPVEELKWRIGHYGVEPFPAFCGRHKFFEAYEGLFRQTEDKPVLAIYTEDSKRGTGRSRLLRELAAQALRDGHVPCLVSSDEPKWPTPPFAGAADLAVEILRAINHAREGFGLGAPLQSRVLKRLIETSQDRLQLEGELVDVESHDDLADFLDRLRPHKSAAAPPSATAVRGWLRSDFLALIQQARSTHPGTVGPEKHIVLLLDDVDRYGAAVSSLLTWLKKKQGLGSILPGAPPGAGAPPETEPVIEEIVPVVLCYSLGYTGDQSLKEAPDKLRFLKEELKPFQKDGDEDMLAYGEAMLFPDPRNSHACQTTENLRMSQPGIQSPVVGFTYNPGADRSTVSSFTTIFRNRIDGSPETMKGPLMWTVIECAYHAKFLLIADDEAQLAKLSNFP
jgi:hypothetical protein